MYNIVLRRRAKNYHSFYVIVSEFHLYESKLARNFLERLLSSLLLPSAKRLNCTFSWFINGLLVFASSAVAFLFGYLFGNDRLATFVFQYHRVCTRDVSSQQTLAEQIRVTPYSYYVIGQSCYNNLVTFFKSL